VPSRALLPTRLNFPTPSGQPFLDRDGSVWYQTISIQIGGQEPLIPEDFKNSISGLKLANNPVGRCTACPARLGSGPLVDGFQAMTRPMLGAGFAQASDRWASTEDVHVRKTIRNEVHGPAAGSGLCLPLIFAQATTATVRGGWWTRTAPAGPASSW